MTTATITNSNIVNVPNKFAGLGGRPLRQNVEVFREWEVVGADGTPSNPTVVTLTLVSQTSDLDDEIIDRLICELCVRGVAVTGYRQERYRNTPQGWRFETFVKGDYSDRLVPNACRVYARACTPEARQWVLHLPTID